MVLHLILGFRVHQTVRELSRLGILCSSPSANQTAIKIYIPILLMFRLWDKKTKLIKGHYI